MAAQLYINPKFVMPQPQVGRQFSVDNDDAVFEGSSKYVSNVADQTEAAAYQRHPPPNGQYISASTRDSSFRNTDAAVVSRDTVYARASGTRPASDLTGLRLSPFHSKTVDSRSPYNNAPAEVGYYTFPRMHAKQARSSGAGDAVRSPAYYADVPPQFVAGPGPSGAPKQMGHDETARQNDKRYADIPSARSMNNSKSHTQLQQPSSFYQRYQQRETYPASSAGGAPPGFVYPRKIEDLRGEMIDTTITKRDTGLGVTIIGGENDEPLQVKSIVPNSAADDDGVLQPGDLLVFISGMNVLDFTHDAVIDIFKSIQVGQKVRIIACRGYPLFTDDSDAPTEYVKEFAVEVGGGDATSAQRASDRGEDTGYYLNEKKALLANGGIPAMVSDKQEERIVTIRKGSIGFGFTIEHSNSTGYQKIKKIGDKNRCGELREGDLLIQINGQRLNTYSHSDIVNVLKRYPQHKDAVFHILRPLSKQQQQAARRGPSTSPRTRSKSATNSAVATPEHDTKGDHDAAPGDGSKHSFLGSLFGKHRRSQRSKDEQQSANDKRRTESPPVHPSDSADDGSKTTAATPTHVRSVSSGTASNFGRNQNAYSSFARIVTPCFVPASHYAATSPMSAGPKDQQQQHGRQAEEPVVTSTTLMMPPSTASTLTNGRRQNPAGGASDASYPQQRQLQDMYAQVIRTPVTQRPNNPPQQQHQPLPSILATRNRLHENMQYEEAQPTDRHRYAEQPYDNDAERIRRDVDEQVAPTGDDVDDDDDDDDDDGNEDDAAFDAVTAAAENAFVAAVEGVQPPSATLGFELQILLKRDDNGFGFRVVGGSEEGTQVSVGYIVPHGAAQMDGRLQTGDEILSVDGESTIGASHQQTVSIIRRAAENGFILLGILRRFESAAEAEAIVSALNAQRNQQQTQHQRPATNSSPQKNIMPDVAVISSQQQSKPMQSRPKQQAPQQCAQPPPPMDIVEISLVRGTDEGFGFVLVSSMANNNNTNVANSDFDDDGDGTDTTVDELLGQRRAPSARYLNACPVIGRILPNSPAYRCEAFRVGDRLLRVNGIDIYNYQHKDIVNIIKNSGNAVSLTIASAPPSAYNAHHSSASPTDNMLHSPSSRFIHSSQNNNSLNQQRRNHVPESPPSVQSTTSTTASVSTNKSTTSNMSNNTTMTLTTSNSEDSTNAHQQNLSTPVAATRQPHHAGPVSSSSLTTAAASTGAAHLPRSNTVPIQSDAVMQFRGGSVVRERGIDLPTDYAVEQTALTTTTGSNTNRHPVLLTNKSVYNVAYLSVELPKGPRGFGFSIRGGKEFESMPLFILKIADEGPAAESNALRVGDEIVEINGVNTRNLTHAEAIGLIKDGGNVVKLLLKRPRRVGSLVGGENAGNNGSNSKAPTEAG